MSVSAIPRTAWQDPAKPVHGPARKQPFRQGVVHWEGAVGRHYTPADIPAHLRSMQASYLASRGYSLGYGFAVVSDVTHPQDGSRWEIRGTDLNMASNPGKKWNAANRQPAGNVNDWTGSVLIIGPDDKPISPKAAEAVRTIFAEWHRDAGTPPVRPFPHSVTDYTTCCGPHYTLAITQGTLDPFQQPTQPTSPPTGDIDMIVLNTPVRSSDTRTFPGVPIAGEHTFGLPKAYQGAQAATVTVTVLGAAADGFATLWGDGPRPNTSNINFQAGPQAIANTTVVRVVNGAFKVFLSTAAHIIVDVAATG